MFLTTNWWGRFPRSLAFLQTFKKFPSALTTLQVSYGSLLRATDGFSSANLIGTGSYGSVYKGVLEHDGTIIAVKVLNLSHNRASRSFLAECEALKNIRHRNLVKLLSACSGVDYQGDDFKALVYEFMANGSLEEWLHPNPNEDFAHNEIKKLGLIQRLNLIIDVACALDYLHHGCHMPIAHCDLKPSNILLDNELVGHLGDFGLAKFLPIATQSLSISEVSSIGVRGSVGYTAPEYGMGGGVSMHGDVYSFGILVLEMFTGRRPTDDMFKDGFSIRNFAEEGLPNKVFDILDPTLIEKKEEHETCIERMKDRSIPRNDKLQECLVSIFKVGIACSVESARERMDIADAAALLNSTRGVLLKMGIYGNRT